MDARARLAGGLGREEEVTTMRAGSQAGNLRESQLLKEKFAETAMEVTLRSK